MLLQTTRGTAVLGQADQLATAAETRVSQLDVLRTDGEDKAEAIQTERNARRDAQRQCEQLDARVNKLVRSMCVSCLWLERLPRACRRGVRHAHPPLVAPH